MAIGTITRTLTVYFEASDKEVDIDVECEYETWNDGIGHWECHGKGFDAGTDYVDIISTEWNKTGYTPEEIAIVEAEIEKSKSEWAGEIMENDDCDCDCDDDYRPYDEY